MFKQLFRSMNDALDDIIVQFSSSSGEKRAELEERLSVLKAMSDTCIEEWLLFEEKLGQLSGKPELPHAAATNAKKEPQKPQESLQKSKKEAVSKPEEPASFAKGQGYYKLAMFKDAVKEFEEVVRTQPDYLLARIYLAMAYLRCEEYAEAYRHFQFLVPLTEDQRIKAISYNAMGCIQAEKQNMDKALEYFRLAHSADPASIEPVLNLQEWNKRN